MIVILTHSICCNCIVLVSRHEQLGYANYALARKT